jgi:hypothetical protein
MASFRLLGLSSLAMAHAPGGHPTCIAYLSKHKHGNIARFLLVRAVR